jgi:hypothetical protein
LERPDRDEPALTLDSDEAPEVLSDKVLDWLARRTTEAR